MAEISSVGVLGSGIMGSGLMEVIARSGRSVTLRSRTQAAADAALAGLEKSLSKQVKKERIGEDEKAQILSRVTVTDHLGDLHECDLIIESVIEDLGIKKALFHDLEQVAKPDAIIATNTSTLPVVELAMVTQIKV